MGGPEGPYENQVGGNVFQQSDGSYVDGNDPRRSGGGGKGELTGGQFLGVLGGIIAVIILPGLIVKLIVGLIWSITEELGKVGKVIQSLAMGIIAPIAVILPGGFAYNALQKVTYIDVSFGNTAQYTTIIALMLIPPIWYFFWHYDVVKVMGYKVFAKTMQWFTSIIWGGLAIGQVFVGIVLQKETTGIWISIICVPLAFVYYFVSTLTYKDNVVRDGSFKFRWIGMAVAVGLTVAWGALMVIGGTIDAKQSIAERAAELEMSLTDQTATTRVQINLRAEPSSNGRLITTLAKGSPLTLKSELSGIWIQAENSGNLGWVLAPFVNMDYRSIFEYKRLYPFEATTTAATQLYEDAQKTKSAGNLPQGSTITIIQTSGLYDGYIEIETKNRKYFLPAIAAENIIPKLNADGSIATIAGKPEVFNSKNPVNATVTEDIVAWHIDTQRYIEIPKGAAVTVTNEFSNVTYDGKRVGVNWWYLKPAN